MLPPALGSASKGERRDGRYGKRNATAWLARIMREEDAALSLAEGEGAIPIPSPPEGAYALT
jgi:hypothetical protein